MALNETIASFIAWSQAVAGDWGYLGIFFINIVGSASIVLPVIPSVIIVIAFAPSLNPWLIGLAAGAGAAIGELTGYALGRGGREMVKSHRWIVRAQGWVAKHGMFPVIVAFAALPLPADVVGILAGVTGYDVKRFLAANLIGKVIKFTAIAWAARLGIDLILAVLA